MEILFATDGRPPANAALELLTRLADPSHVRVTVLSARNPEAAPDRLLDEGVAEAERALRDAGVGFRALRMTGDPVVCIEKVLAEGHHGSLVLGAGNHSWLDRLAFGSVSTHMLHAAHTPVLVAHRAPDPAHQRLRVLVGADGSGSAAHAIDTLASITGPDRVDVEVRSVVPTPELGFSVHPGAYVPATYIEDLMEAEGAEAEGHLNEALDRCHGLGFSPHGSLGNGWPGNDLLHFADEKAADLVVVGARGLGVVARMAMGSVSAHVARHAPATLVAHASVYLADGEIVEPDRQVSKHRYAVRWR
jgi:nucleotide-binding universal stress UspA family protein